MLNLRWIWHVFNIALDSLDSESKWYHWTAGPILFKHLGFALSQHVQLADKLNFEPCQALVTDMISVTDH